VERIEEGKPVYALLVPGHGEIKRDWDLIGPIDLDDPLDRETLDKWARRKLGAYGGYIHLSTALSMNAVALDQMENR
jgi:hypothetical protein